MKKTELSGANFPKTNPSLELQLSRKGNSSPDLLVSQVQLIKTSQVRRTSGASTLSPMTHISRLCCCGLVWFVFYSDRWENPRTTTSSFLSRILMTLSTPPSHTSRVQPISIETSRSDTQSKKIFSRQLGEISVHFSSHIGWRLLNNLKI